MTESPLRRRQYVWRWIWQTHPDWNEISFDPNAQTSTRWPVSPTISHIAHLATNTMVSCASQRLNDKYIEREGEKEGRQKQMEWNYKAGPPSEEEISQHNRSYQSMSLFNNSDVSGYQVPDRCEESESACGDEERWLIREETYWIWKLCMYTDIQRSFELSFDNVTGHSSLHSHM